MHQNQEVMDKKDSLKIEDQALCELAYLLGKKAESDEIKESVRETAEEVLCFSF